MKRALPPTAIVSEEVHVAGIVVHCQPQQADGVAQALARIAGAAVHGAGADGKLAVTLEAASASAIATGIDAFRALPGVLSVALVYQHHEPLEAMMEEIASEDHAPGLY
jgi:nitrate reductase NapD